MIKNVVFDIGNVLLRFNPKEYFSKMYDNEEIGRQMCDLIMQSQIWKDYDLGCATLEEIKVDFSNKVPSLKNEICAMLDAWLHILVPITYTFDKLESLRKDGYKIYLLSNLSDDAFNYIDANFHLFDKVDGYIVSFKEQVAKPDFAIYERLMSRFNLNKEECVFLDDTLVNVEASNTFGMKAIHFKNEEQVEKELMELLEG